MFGYRCQECGKGTVRPKRVKNYEARFGGRSVIVPTAIIGVCDFCGSKHYSASERKRWKALLSQRQISTKEG
ncbi:MAG: YgiT-type zinc finger protein [Armatimonadetes bacterium]|nr:YgiT-type zinc finger protein [Armatimonadota bacterium]